MKHYTIYYSSTHWLEIEIKLNVHQQTNSENMMYECHKCDLSVTKR